MTPQDITLIRHHMSQLRGLEEAFAGAFYAQLFRIAPELRGLFHSEMTQQGAKLMKVLAFAVGALDKPEVLAPAVRQLGGQHRAYGVKVEDFQPVAAALLHTLAAALGEAFDAQAEVAWTSAFMALAGLMAEGMASAARAAA